MHIAAKNVIWGLEGEDIPPQDAFLLEPIAVFVGKEKMTSGSEDKLLWCEWKLAKQVLVEDKVTVFDGEQFDRRYYGRQCIKC